MRRVFGFALILFSFIAYCNAIRHPFVHDDVFFILKNPHISDLSHWYLAFKQSASVDGLNTYYRPVLEIIYRFEYHLFGNNPVGYHVVNILLHTMNGLLLFGLLQRIGLSLIVSWGTALLFLIHPVQTEAVACISGVSNLWMTLGILSALIAYLNGSLIFTVAWFAMAFLSKEQAVMFLPLVIVIDISRGKIFNRNWIILGLSTIALLCLRDLITGSSLLNEVMASPGEFVLRLSAIPRDIGMYLHMIFCPNDLHYYRCTDILQSNQTAWVLAIVSILGLIVLCLRYPMACPVLFLGLGWFLACLSPVLNIAPLINEYSFILTPEHFLYLPIVGILIIAVAGIDYHLKHFRKIILALVVSTCLLLTWYQNIYWRSEITLFQRMIQFEPNFGRGHLLLAKAYYFQFQWPQAEGHFQKAYTIMNGYVHKTSNVNAKKFYLKYLKEILFDWAENESAMGQWQGALDKYHQEETFDPQNAALDNNIAYAYLHLGQKNEAINYYKKALAIDPSFDQAQRNLLALTLPDTRQH